MVKQPTRGNSPTPTIDVNLLALSGEIGLKLAVPLIILMLIGIKLDRMYHSVPLFMFIGATLALTTSVIMISRMIRRTLKDQA